MTTTNDQLSAFSGADPGSTEHEAQVTQGSGEDLPGRSDDTPLHYRRPRHSWRDRRAARSAWSSTWADDQRLPHSSANAPGGIPLHSPADLAGGQGDPVHRYPADYRRLYALTPISEQLEKAAAERQSLLRMSLPTSQRSSRRSMPISKTAISATRLPWRRSMPPPTILTSRSLR